MSRSTYTLAAFFATTSWGFVWLSGCEQVADKQAEQPKTGQPKTEALAEVAAGQTQVKVPRIVPGTPLRESDFEQTLRATGAEFVVVQVYAEACGPCITEALKLTQIEKQWRDQGVAILGMGMDETSAGPVSFFNSTGGRVKFPLYLAPWFAKQQQVEATPALFIYSANGTQVYRGDPASAETNTIAALSEKLTELLAGG